ncbi:MAG: HAMP domain-containing histidine kinase [Rhizobiaceae bacterium]|nr:HAMP domain-containing histidine kinase [Rhizobiaceae bacterium]MCV0405354.1 HAMP domain-containing histidine kinase [Rhizobiaceae bacterium]
MINVAIIAALAVFLGVALVKLTEIERNMRINAAENMLWVIYQAHVASLRLDSEIVRGTNGAQDTDVERRFDVLVSRLTLMREGPQYRYLETLGLDREFLSLSDAAIDMGRAYGDPPAGGAAFPVQAHETLQRLNAWLARAANAAMVREWNAIGERLDSYRHALWQVLAAILGIMISGAVLSIRLVSTLRRVRSAERSLRAARELEKELERERAVSRFYRDFASTISHQFRTPLAIIDSSMQRLSRRGERVTATEIAERVGRVRTATRRLARLVERTLDAARLDTGQIEVHLQSFDLVGLVRGICERHREHTPGRRINFVAAGRSGSAEICTRCDPVMIEHIVDNLISNAVKYSPPDKPVEVRVEAHDGAALCSVRDEGVGIPAREMPRLFERFFRASTASGVPGTGIGLNLARNLARMQGGDIDVETCEGAGSTFTLRLPLVEEAPNGGSAAGEEFAHREGQAVP